MQWNSVPNEEPSVVFPVGTIFEDEKAVYKIIGECVKQGTAHKYKVEVLNQKIPIPEHLKYFIDPKFQTYVVLAQNLDKIQRIA